MDILNNEYSHECDDLKKLVKIEETCSGFWMPCSKAEIEEYNKKYAKRREEKIKEDESNGIFIIDQFGSDLYDSDEYDSDEYDSDEGDYKIVDDNGKITIDITSCDPYIGVNISESELRHYLKKIDDYKNRKNK
jgi:hypothetical protein